MTRDRTTKIHYIIKGHNDWDLLCGGRASIFTEKSSKYDEVTCKNCRRTLKQWGRIK